MRIGRAVKYDVWFDVLDRLPHLLTFAEVNRVRLQTGEDVFQTPGRGRGSGEHVDIGAIPNEAPRKTRAYEAAGARDEEPFVKKPCHGTPAAQACNGNGRISLKRSVRRAAHGLRDSDEKKSVYQRIVRESPSSKVREGCQPRMRCAFWALSRW